VWKFEPFTDLGGHLAQHPDVPQDGSVFRLALGAAVAGIWLGSWESARAFKRIIVADISKRVYLLVAFQVLGEDPSEAFREI